MPTYDYRCEACGHELELFQNISAAPKKKCPACKKSRLKRLIGGGAGFLFKGSGFYLTDYRSESYRKAAESESKGSEAKSEPKGETKGETKADKPQAKSGDAAGAKPAASAPAKPARATKKGT